MRPDGLDFLKGLLDAPGPSAFELEPARRWRAEARQVTPDVDVDVSGSSWATLPGAGSHRLVLAGHMDEIGILVSHVDDDGFLSFDTIGGWDSQIFVGQRVQLLGRGGPVAGVIGKKAIHLMEREEREKVSKIEELWVDIGATSRAQALERVRVGDPGVLASSVLEFPNGRLVSRSIDNRIGSFVVLEALRLLRDSRPRASVTAVATSREEISSNGGGARPLAVRLDPTVAIVVDVTHATDMPGMEKRKHGDYRLGGGPVLSRGAAVNDRVFELLAATAEAEAIPYAIEAAGRDTRTDAEGIFNAARGVATGLVSVPNRYMHSPNEMVAIEDLERTARLLAAFASRLTDDVDFVPR